MKPIIRKATKKDLEDFADFKGVKYVTQTVRAWVGEVDGEVLGMGGFARHQGRWVAFCDLKDEARKYKVTIVKMAQMILREADRMGIKFAYATVDAEEANAIRWMETLGFQPDLRSGGKLMRRKGR
jgi:N-acetylglutamate synthase-like GNAT family acetyltransferase